MIQPLTSLRFFFAFFVFLSHLSFITTDNNFYNWLKRNVFFEGYLGVSFFFILSGFVLSYSCSKFIKNDNFELNIKNFYLARVFRIYPLHFLTLLISAILFKDFHQFPYKEFFANTFLIQSFFIDSIYINSFNGPSWSISNELFFYLLFPILITLFLKNKKTLITFFVSFLLLLIISRSLINTELEKFVYYINPITRLLDFILGISIYFIYKKYHKSITKKGGSILEITSILVFLIFFLPHNMIDRAFRYSMYYWVPMSLIIFAFSFQKGIISKILSNKLLVYLGEISFAFYMIHLIVINVFRQFNFSNHIIYTPLTLLLISLLLSSIIFEFFEKPINRYLKNTFIK